MWLWLWHFYNIDLNSKIHTYDLGCLKFLKSWCMLDYLKVLFQQLEGIVMGLTCEIFQLSCTNSKTLFFIHHLAFVALKLGLPLKCPFLQNHFRVFVKCCWILEHSGNAYLLWKWNQNKKRWNFFEKSVKTEDLKLQIVQSQLTH